ncbi:hypothetical protein TWF102_004124 [Orbilia oligospora]|uniref:Uncharacterized protein n=1 Tax=Orbilia oligospora TaxID=2813651 RepID=A0A7C8NK84_ORBOL|nr:hypothetical protein TWF706_006677 [Orbilia oligospora]KAF3112728.1 hypothetical protein TWF102_004124 [Orbilia oligospora]KAF3117655.1 hypothetical protein TWF103_004336 [Orbilia oligospora]KAF3152054.1 hypothetical protein TWF594_005809 [Orbilia oligospora]
MNLILLAALGLSTLSQTVVARSIVAPIIEPEPEPEPIKAVRPYRYDTVIKTSLAIEKNPGKVLSVEISYTPDYSLKGRANLTFAETNPARPALVPFKMMFLCPDCPIAFGTPTLSPGSGIGDRTFTPFTLHEASYPRKLSKQRSLIFRVEFIPPQKPRVSADYAITFYRQGKPAFKYIYEKHMPPGHPINYIILQNERGGTDWVDLKAGVVKPPPNEVPTKERKDDSEGDDIDRPPKSAAPKEEKGGDDGDDGRGPKDAPTKENQVGKEGDDEKTGSDEIKEKSKGEVDDTNSED